MEKSFFVYASDLLSEGPENALGKIQDLGANTIWLASSYHAGKFTRPRAASGKIFFPDDGTVYFRPDPKYYGTIQPRTNRLVQENEFLKEL